MSTEEYISSGILEAYVLGQLAKAENAEVEIQIAKSVTVREELDRIERSFEALATAAEVEPSSQMKNRLINQVAGEAPIIKMSANSNSSSIVKIAIAASLIVAIGTSLIAYIFWSKWQSAESRIADLVAQNQQIAKEFNTVNQQIDVLNNPLFVRIVMQGTDSSPNSIASVYWNDQSNEVYLNIQNLETLDPDEQFQLWAIIDGKPVDAGVFDGIDQQSLILMKEVRAGASAFAVTIEPRGGSESPTLSRMQVIGNV